jgi:hypothetical protein
MISSVHNRHVRHDARANAVAWGAHSVVAQGVHTLREGAQGAHALREVVRGVHKHGVDTLPVAWHDAHDAYHDNHRHYQYE